MLKCSASLWSADLSNLGADIRRVEPYTERFHLDVADGHYVPSMLFFPDLVKALGKHTSKPFEVHLMTTDPLAWVEPFVEAGADLVIFCFDSLTRSARGDQEGEGPGEVRGDLTAGHRAGQRARAVLEGDRSGHDRRDADGNERDLDGAVDLAKIREARAAIEKQGAKVEIQLDGGIRRNTVPQINEAGGDWIVPGSMMFGEDPAAMRAWLASLG